MADVEQAGRGGGEAAAVGGRGHLVIVGFHTQVSARKQVRTEAPAADDHWVRPGKMSWMAQDIATKTFARLFRISELGENCSQAIDFRRLICIHVIHKGLDGFFGIFRDPTCHTTHTSHTAICHIIHTSMTRFCHTLHTSMLRIQPRLRGRPGCQRAILSPRIGRGPRQETRIPSPGAMFRSMEGDAKGRRSRTGVISGRCL